MGGWLSLTTNSTDWRKDEPARSELANNVIVSAKAPLNAFSLWEPFGVLFSLGEFYLGSYNYSPCSTRMRFA
jgi:hypothetical protein